MNLAMKQENKQALIKLIFDPPVLKSDSVSYSSPIEGTKKIMLSMRYEQRPAVTISCTRLNLSCGNPDVSP